MSNRKYNHAEAFCLMSYKCEKCGETEQLWNSRDGVTPFVIGCKSCDGSMVHINWQSDKRIPDYIPMKGQRVFIDIPESLKRPLALERTDHFKDSEFKIPDEEHEETIKAIMASFHEGEPYLVTW